MANKGGLSIVSVFAVDVKKYKKIIFPILFFTIHCLLFTHYCLAGEEAVVTSETLEYFGDTSIYIAKGSVKIQKGDRVIESDEISYNEQNSEIVATGNVRYDDPEITITASTAEINLEKETGKLYNAEVFHKIDNYHILGREIEKRGEKYFFSAEASFTTCDAPVPAWCFKGRDIDIFFGERLKARDASFRIKNVPVLYTPYFWAAIYTERKTGFLTPTTGYSSSRGFYISLPFFWNISENRDATVFMDLYTRRGMGQGLEYRYIAPEDIKGNWWLYHIRDTNLNKNYFEIRGFHEQWAKDRIGGFLNINYVNEEDFYREFSSHLEIRTKRFLESTGEISLPFKYSRLYLLSQYWVDLKEEIRPTTQRLPEVGYILYPTKFSYFWFSAAATLSNFWREEDTFGRRLDIYPRILHKFGKDVIVSQALGFRETAYSLQKAENNFLHREAIEYSVLAHTRIMKRYQSFTHVLEPSLGYTLITDSESLPLFDSTELFEKTSKVELSLLNRFLNKGGEFAVVKASQGFDAEKGDRPFLPFRLEVGINKPLALRIDSTYDIHKGRLTSINSDMYFRIPRAAISVGQRYNEQEDVSVYKVGFDLYPSKPWYINTRLWYDEKDNEVFDITVDVKYLGQCWGINVFFNKRPGDYTVGVRFELQGITKNFKT